MKTSEGATSLHEDRWADVAFVDHLRGGLLDTERAVQARQKKVKRCRGVGFWWPVVRKGMEAESSVSALD